MLKVENLSYTYPESRRPVLKGATLHIRKGMLCGLFGPNGSGKSTLFKCCLKLLTPGQGRIVVNGRDIRGLKVSEIARHAAYVPQEHTTPFPYSVREVVLMGRTPHLGWGFRISRKDIRAVDDALERLGIRELSHLPYNTLSGGQRQLALMARAVAQAPKIMFLDEPASALDFSNQIRLWETMKAMAAQGVTIFACSHDPNHVSWFCDQVVVVRQGKVYRSGAPEMVMTQDTLDAVYRESCRVRHVDRVPVVFPSRLNGFFYNTPPVCSVPEETVEQAV